MRRILTLLAALALALPTAVFATSSIDYSNSGGTLAASGGALTLSGSDLISIRPIPGGTLIAGTLGSVSFTTGALASGSLSGACPINQSCQIATFAAGGTFTITGNGMNGAPSGVIFKGTFTQADWTLKTLSDGTHSYTFSGGLQGTNASGFGSTSDVSTQLTVNTGKGYFNGIVDLSSGDTNLVTPEPGSLGLLGTGLIGLAGVVRRKLRS
jgi:hypothetical protein